MDNVDLAKGVAGAVAGATLAAVTKQTQIGNFNGNINQYGYGKAYIKITRKKNYSPEHIQDTYGYPANTWVKLGSAKGYVKVKDIKLSLLGATKDELEQVESLLKNGVFI